MSCTGDDSFRIVITCLALADSLLTAVAGHAERVWLAGLSEHTAPAKLEPHGEAVAVERPQVLAED
jgi:hypothetical protein